MGCRLNACEAPATHWRTLEQEEVYALQEKADRAYPPSSGRIEVRQLRCVQVGTVLGPKSSIKEYFAIFRDNQGVYLHVLGRGRHQTAKPVYTEDGARVYVGPQVYRVRGVVPSSCRVIFHPEEHGLPGEPGPLVDLTYVRVDLE